VAGFRATKTQLNLKFKFRCTHDSTYVAKKDLPAVDADQLFNLFQENLWTLRFGNYYCVSKSMGKKLEECKSKSYLN
jgi:peptidyl-prolyl cis-trans isomerase D